MKGNPNPIANQPFVSLSHVMAEIQRVRLKLNITEDPLTYNALLLQLQGWEEQRDRLVGKRRLPPAT